MITAIGIALCVTAAFLLLAGERISRRRIRQAPADLTWIEDRIRTDPSHRATWRSLRSVMQEEDEL